MKELSIEQKAKRYDGNYKAYTELISRLEDVKDAIKKQNYGIAMDILCKPYPQFQVITHSELKESEDERMKKLCISVVKQFAAVCRKEDKYLPKVEKCITWLEKQCEQNPAWSEEDYNEIETIACHLDNIDNEGMAEVLRNIRDKYYHTIPQSTWRPSEEQMKCLKDACDKYWEPDGLDPLYTLYEQLKAL